MAINTNEHFVLKNQLAQETKEKLILLHTEENDLKQKIPGVVFVHEWMEDGENIIGYGNNIQGNSSKLIVKIEPGIFGVTNNRNLLQSICAIMNYRVIFYDNVTYRCNNFTLHDLLMDYSLSERPTILVKIVTPTIKQATDLFYRFRKDERSYKYISVPLYWSVNNQIMFERMLKCQDKSKPTDYTVPKVTMRWFDSYLNVYKLPEPVIPIITFDIETVSTDPNRVPTGEHCDDELFTVSIHHNHTNIVYTLIYLPLVNTSPQKMKELIYNDGYPNYDDLTNIVETFVTEKSLLLRTMELLSLGEKLHYLIGYNSMSYDMKYLLLRCGFYGISLDKFVYREGYSYGFNQIHFDLFRIIMAQYKFKSYSLSNVSRHFLKETKTGVNAVQLRYTFHAMRKYQKYFNHDECFSWPSVRDILHYNNYDTILVSKLLKKSFSIEFTINQAHECRIPLSNLNTNYNKMKYKMWSQCFIVGLGIGIFQSTFKSTIASMKYPVYDNDFIDIRINLEDQLLGDKKIDDNSRYKYQTYNIVDTKKKYPGGANFCLGEYSVDTIQMLDYRIAYPLLIDRKNISDETASILPASVICAMYKYLTEIQTKNFKSHDYLTHTGSTKSEATILYHQYIYNKFYCGGEFPFTYEELFKRNDSPVILIWEGRRGVLSDIITKFNTIREETKNKRKTLDAVLNIIEDKINEIIEEKREIDLLNETNFQDNSFNDLEEKFNNHMDYNNNDDGNFDCNDILSENELQNNSMNFNSTNNNDDDGDFGILLDDSDDEDCKNIDDGDFGDLSSDDENNDNINTDNCIKMNENIECKSKVEQTNPKQLSNQSIREIENPFNFKFVNEYICVYENKTCVINDEALKTMDSNEQIKKLEEIKIAASLERDCYGNSYDLQKSLVASIYGCIGTSSPVCAALITCCIRSTLLQAAQYIVSNGYTVYYIDTDSLFIKHPTKNEDLSPQLNKLFPHTEIEMKLYKRCMFVQKKTYYKLEDGVLKYGQHVNGPDAWRDCVYYFYQQSRMETNQNIIDAFNNFFRNVYGQLMTHENITSEFLASISQDIKLKSHYKTRTTHAKLKEYLHENYPALAGSWKQTIYYQLEADVKSAKFIPTINLKTIDQLATVNLFKYYQNIFKTIFNIVKFHIKKNNEPFTVTLSSKHVLCIMMSSFLNVHREIFPRYHLSGNVVDEVTSFDFDEFPEDDEDN